MTTPDAVKNKQNRQHHLTCHGSSRSPYGLVSRFGILTVIYESFLGLIQAREKMFSLAVMAALTVACSSIPQERPPQPESRNPLEYIQILESAERVKGLQVERVIRNLPIEKGDLIADIGSGSGLFTIPLAQETGPGGKVYAVDIEEELLEYVETIASRNGLNNIETVLADELDPRLPEPVDLVLICDTLSYIEDQPLYLKGLAKYLRPGSLVAVIDRLSAWPLHLQQSKYSPEDLDGWMNDSGLQRIKAFRFHENAFFNIYSYQGK